MRSGHMPETGSDVDKAEPEPTHAFLQSNAAPTPAWTASARGTGSRFDRLMFIAGQGDFDASGRLRNYGQLLAQVDGAMRAVNSAVTALDGSPSDIVKLVVFHTASSAEEETTLLRAIRACIAAEPPPVVSLVALPRLSVSGLEILVKAVAIDNSDGCAPRRDANPPACPPWPSEAIFSAGLRCGEFVFVSAQTSKDTSGAIVHRDDITAQARQTIKNIACVLNALDCDLDDVIKLNTWYVGFGTDEDWRRAAEVRSSAFRFPGPCATGVPVPNRYPDGGLIRQECMALRGNDGSRMPRSLTWPLGHWDWPLPVSFQQGIRVGRLIVLGGQYSMDEKGLAVDPDDMQRQTANTLEFIRRVLSGFGARMDDLMEVTGFYKHGTIIEGTPLTNSQFGGCRPALTEVPLFNLGLEQVTLEVEGFAILPAATALRD